MKFSTIKVLLCLLTLNIVTGKRTQLRGAKYTDDDYCNKCWKECGYIFHDRFCRVCTKQCK